MKQFDIEFEDNNNLPDSVKIQVDGKIVNELSKQVSSHLFALGELMKNSYDAKATIISITFDMKKNKLIIDDNGDGINLDNIQSLLHIAKSGKEYGREFSFNSKNKTITRYTQGSKGLGLFCAFKFGNKVQWDTKFGNHSYSISVNKDDIVESSDISQINFPLRKGSRTTIGTTITIDFDPQDPELHYISQIMNISKNYKKLVNFFYDDSMNVKFKIIPASNSDDKTKTLETIPKKTLNNLLSEHKLFDIEYHSDTNKIIYKDFNSKEYIKVFTKKNNTNDYKIFLKLNAYSFPQGYHGVKNIDNIFHNLNGDLSPLVYINGVLFNNDHIFNPTITRKIQSGRSLPQLTGFIEIFCTNTGLQFNNERTELIDNAFNDRLKKDLIELNKFLQEEGKKLEKLVNPKKQTGGQSTEGKNTGRQSNEGQNTDGQSNEGQNTDGQSNEGQNTGGQSTEGQNTGGQSNEGKNTGGESFTPFINLNKTKDIIKFNIESEIIDLKKYFENAKDSKGRIIPIDNIKISVNNISILSPFLSSIDHSTSKSIKYSFIDDYHLDTDGNQLVVSKSLTLIFVKKDTKFDPKDTNSTLIKPIGYSDYQILLEGVDRLIKQINLLYENYKEFDMCLASALRLIFDLTTYRYQQITKDEINSDPLEKQVASIITKIISEDNGRHFTKVAARLDPRHKINKNTFSPGLFSQRVATSNLGSHTGSSHLSEETIKDIAMHAGYYAQLVDAHCREKGLIS